MTVPMPPRLAFCRTVIAVLWAVMWLGGEPALGARATASPWQAVLVAGDNAEPVFDNAVDALARWLGAGGVAISDIRRLSANPAPRDLTSRRRGRAFDPNRLAAAAAEAPVAWFITRTASEGGDLACRYGSSATRRSPGLVDRLPGTDRGYSLRLQAAFCRRCDARTKPNHPYCSAG
jgi:hypothetical protein